MNDDTIPAEAYLTDAEYFAAFSRSTRAAPCHTVARTAAEKAYRLAKAEDRAKMDTFESLVEALERINNWSNAYPLEVFPEPDFKLAQKGLKSVGITLDAVSASNMRHVVEGVGNIAREALAVVAEVSGT